MVVVDAMVVVVVVVVVAVVVIVAVIVGTGSADGKLHPVLSLRLVGFQY